MGPWLIQRKCKEDVLTAQGMENDTYSVSSTVSESGRTHFQIRVGDIVTDRSSIDKEMDGNRAEKRSGKSWRKEREEKERKRGHKTYDSSKEIEEKDKIEDAAA